MSSEHSIIRVHLTREAENIPPETVTPAILWDGKKDKDAFQRDVSEALQLAVLKTIVQSGPPSAEAEKATLPGEGEKEAICADYWKNPKQSHDVLTQWHCKKEYWYNPYLYLFTPAEALKSSPLHKSLEDYKKIASSDSPYHTNSISPVDLLKTLLKNDPALASMEPWIRTIGSDDGYGFYGKLKRQQSEIIFDRQFLGYATEELIGTGVIQYLSPSTPYSEGYYEDAALIFIQQIALGTITGEQVEQTVNSYKELYGHSANPF